MVKVTKVMFTTVLM